MRYTENALNVLTAKSYPGIGNAWVVKNLHVGQTSAGLVALLAKKLKCCVEDFYERRERFEKSLLHFSESCDGVVAIGDEDFPINRGIVNAQAEQPVFLFYKGDISLLQSGWNVAVIGLLNPSDDIVVREKRLVAELVANGATIVSGLALGCDSVAHEQALLSHGKTIAILPSPLHQILPTKNKVLADRIVKEGGVLVSEYGTTFKSVKELSGRYKERDRLQALFSDVVILAASYALNTAHIWEHLQTQKLDSGARLAMEYAVKYGVPRAVMYDFERDYDNPMFDLNRQALDNVAMVLGPADLATKIEKLYRMHKKRNNLQLKQGALF